MTIIIGLDIGGTFTDAFAADSAGRVTSFKTPSTPPDYSAGFLRAIEGLAETWGMATPELLGETEYIVHGTTATLNALVVGDVTPVGFLTTAGHRDSIQIMNLEGRYAGLGPDAIQNLARTNKPAPLLPPHMIAEIMERVDYKGMVVAPLDEEDARAKIRTLLDGGAQAFAISLLWSFANPAHEQRLRRIVEETAPGTFVGLSSDLTPRIREYQRNVTTIMNAQVAPKLERYLSPLEHCLTQQGFNGALLVMQGSGGAVLAAEAPERAITTIGSVLTGGVIGCVEMGRVLGHRNVISTDIGGTTFLVGMVVDGEPVKSSNTVLGQWTISTPMVKVSTIGAGGGAIAWVDPGGNLRVGPQSAQASPGPACYGEGGEYPTVTDADLVLGIINPDAFLGGRKRLRVDLARKAIEEHVARHIGQDVEQAAAAIYAIQNAQAADLLREVVVNNGYDPRDFIVYAFGGAGPVHCAQYVADLGARHVLVPLGATASAFSAFGLAASDVVLSGELSRPATFPLDPLAVQDAFQSLEKELEDRIARQEVAFETVTYRREIDVKYTLQLAEVSVAVPDGQITADTITEIERAFGETYARLYGEQSGFPDAGMQAMTCRCFVTGTLPFRPVLPAADPADGGPRISAQRRALLDPLVGFETTPVYSYRDLAVGHAFAGPAIVEADTTTVAVPRGARAEVDHLGNLAIELPLDGHQGNAS